MLKLPLVPGEVRNQADVKGSGCRRPLQRPCSAGKKPLSCRGGQVVEADGGIKVARVQDDAAKLLKAKTRTVAASLLHTW
jgi:hypothetical protein